MACSRLRHSQPALTPLLLVAEKHLRPESRASRVPDPWSLPFLSNSVWGAALVASFAIFILSDWNLRETALSTVPVAALLVVYVALIPRSAEGTRFLPLVNIDEAIVPLSLWTGIMLVVTLCAQTFTFGLPSNVAVAPALLLGLAKALAWYFTIQTVCIPADHCRAYRTDTLL